MSAGMELSDLAQLKDFLMWKKEKPEEYQEFLIEFKLFALDMKKLINEAF
jgi:hypothetical protein